MKPRSGLTRQILHPRANLNHRTCLKAVFTALIAAQLAAASLIPIATAQETKPAPKAEIIDRAYFFQQFRSQFYRISESEAHLVDRYERVLDYWDSQAHLTDLRWLAYILATTYHETGRRIQAVRECFGKTDQASIDCVTGLYRRGRIKRNYAKIDPKTGKAYFGRGHVQLTWDYNYKRMGKELGMEDKVYTNPDLALHPDTSVAIMSEGMIKGLFTGKRLSQYFNSSATNWGGARRIVNGLDKYKQIAGYARKFHATLKTKPSAKPDPDEDDCTAETIPQSCLTELNAEIARLRSNHTAINNSYQNALRDNKALQDRVNGLEVEVADLKKQIPDNAAALQALTVAYADLETRFKTANSENQANKAENTRLTALNSELQQKLDDAITTGAIGSDGDLLKRRLAELDAKAATLEEKITAVNLEQTRLDGRAKALDEQSARIKNQLNDIDISKDALQARETNLLSDLERLDRQQKTLADEADKLNREEERLKRYEQNLDKEKAAFEEYKSKGWMSKMWDNVSSTWRNE